MRFEGYKDAPLSERGRNSDRPVMSAGRLRDVPEPRPRVVENAAAFAFASALLFNPGLLILGLSGEPGPSGVHKSGPPTFAVSLLLGWFVFQTLLGFGVLARSKEAWRGYWIAGCLGMLSIPFGTLVYGYLLIDWVKPETKAWFRLR